MTKIKSGFLRPFWLSAILLISPSYSAVDVGTQTLPANGRLQQDTVDCDETAPPCDEKHEHVNTSRFANSLLHEGNGFSGIVNVITISPQTRPVCTLDPLKDIGNVVNNLMDNSWVDLRLYIECTDDTRLILQPQQNLTSPNIRVTLWNRKCTIYWKDFDRLGQYLNIYTLILTDWKDEFEMKSSEYFTECVNLSKALVSTNQMPGISERMYYISGLVLVGSLNVISNLIRTVSPAFTRYQWSVLGEIGFNGYQITAADTSAMKTTMPVLQVAKFVGGELALSHLAFPWYKSPMLLPNNISFAFIDDNDPDGFLPSNYYRRSLVMNAVDISQPRNFTLKGFLQSVTIKYCNIPHVQVDMFTNIEKLLYLDLSHNQILLLEENSLFGLSYLIHLDLGNNHLSHLPSRIFDGLSNLETLLISENQLLTIETSVFGDLFNLNHIDLSENNITNISDNALGRNPFRFNKLSIVNLNRNALTRIPIWLLETPHLGIANLEYNLISFEGFQLMLSKLSDIGFTPPPLLSFIRVIYLQHNSFYDFDISQLSWDDILQFEILSHFMRLDFGEVFHCDCKMFALYSCLHDVLYCSANTSLIPQELIDHRDRLFRHNRESFKCLTPAVVRGLSLTNVAVTTFGCYKDVVDCPPHCRCWVRSWDNAVRVECINMNLTQLPRVLPEHTKELNYSINLLVGLPRDLPQYFDSIEVIDFSHNNIKGISWEMFNKMSDLRILHLHDNDITILPRPVVDLSLNMTLTLAGNNFPCDCSTLWLKNWLLARRQQIADINQVLCDTGEPQAQPIIEAPDAEFICVRDEMTIIIGVSILAGVLALLIIAILVVYKYRGEIKVVLYTRLGWHPFDCSDDSDILGKKYDAFVSYGHHDSGWVRRELLPRLEEGNPPFRLCLHERDFLVGEMVSDNITSAINTSRRMILLLSNAFLQSHWCHTEFILGYQKVLEERSNYLIVILCEDVPLDDMEENMRLYLKTNTYLSRDNRWFWEKLRYAMPQKPLSEIEMRGNVNVRGNENVVRVADQPIQERCHEIMEENEGCTGL